MESDANGNWKQLHMHACHNTGFWTGARVCVVGEHLDQQQGLSLTPVTYSSNLHLGKTIHQIS